MKEHINYYQLFHQKLQETTDRIHTNNQIIVSMILLIGEFNFNEWYAGIIEECDTYHKLDFKELFETSSSLLHNSLRNKKCFVDDNVCIHYDECGIHETPKSEIYETALYYALTLDSGFWVIHQLVLEYHFS